MRELQLLKKESLRIKTGVDSLVWGSNTTSLSIHAVNCNSKTFNVYHQVNSCDNNNNNSKNKNMLQIHFAPVSESQLSIQAEERVSWAVGCPRLALAIAPSVGSSLNH